MNTPDRPVVGISACLLGEAVRYDGGDKRSPAVLDALDSLVRWVTVCPEVEAGLGVPREPIRLEWAGETIRVRGVESRVDVTDDLEAWSQDRLDALDAEALDGFVLKSASPSCGPTEVPVHDEAGRPTVGSAGLFAYFLLSRWPMLPVADERDLEDPARREAFVQAVLTRHRLRRDKANASGDA